MSAVLMSRFLLDLRYKWAHPNGTTGRSISLPIFHAASHQIHSAIICDFGDPMLTQSAGGGIALEEIGIVNSTNHTGEEGSSVNLEIASGSSFNGLQSRLASPILGRAGYKDDMCAH
jgi:hypothetical protein